MLTDSELENYFEKHHLSARAREYIRQTRNDPSRLVGANAQANVVSGYPSAKGDVTLQTESRTAEHAQAIEHEYDQNVLVFFDQPLPVSVVRTSVKGKPLTGSCTPDFVVLHVTGPYVEEVKTEEELEKLLRTKPADWVKTDTGVTFRPALEAYAQIGLPYKVVSSATTNPIRTDNLKLLLRARHSPPAVNDDICTVVERALSEQAWFRLEALGCRIGITDLTPLLQLINQGFLHASLSEELLAQPESTWVAKTPEILALRKICSADQHGYRAPEIGELRVSTTLVPSGKRAARAISNIARLHAGEKSRTVRRLTQKIRLKTQGGKETNEFLSALPDFDKCGNRTQRLCNEQLKFISEFIEEHYAKALRLGPTAAYKLYINLARDAHPYLPPVSRPTLKNYITQVDTKKIGAGRGGRRAANAAAEPTPVGKRQLLATRPFQLGVTDHYLTDIHCVLASRDGKHYTARPYLTVLVDIVTGYVYAIWLSFRAPSRRACAMTIRLCVRKHGRLPEEILFDGGPEFESVYFYALLGHCKVGPVRRPPEHPRYGSQAERFFGEFKTLWLSLRPGNLVNYDEARAVSRTHAPPKMAKLTIQQLLEELLAFCEWRNANRVDLSNLSPAERVKKGMQTFSCSGIPVADDPAFMIASAVDVNDYALDPARGLHIGELHYWHPDLRKLASIGRAKEVREEPEDPYRVYVKVGSEWVTCMATGALQFSTKDPVLRLSDSIRIQDGPKARLEAKADADQLLITKMREFDAKWAAEAVTASAQASTASATKPAESIFESIRSKSVEPLKVSKWDKS